MFFSKSRNSKIIVASLVLATLLGFAQIGLYNNSQLTANAGGPDYSTTLTFCQGNTSKQILTLKSSAGNQINVVSSKLPQNFFYGSEILGLQNTSTVVTFYPSYSLVQNLGYVKDYSNIIVQQSNRSGNIGKKLYIEIIFNIINCNYSNNSSSSSRINSTSSFSQNYYSSVIPTSSVVYNSSKAASSVLTSSSKTNSSSSLVNSSYVVPVSSAIFTSSKAASSMVYNSSRANSSAVSSQNYFSSAIPVSSQTNIYRSSSSSISSLAKKALDNSLI